MQASYCTLVQKESPFGAIQAKLDNCDEAR